jgi:hypothetical protein
MEVSDTLLTSDAGLLPLRQFDQGIGLPKQFAAVLDDPRPPDLSEHSFTEMVRMRKGQQGQKGLRDGLPYRPAVLSVLAVLAVLSWLDRQTP